MSGSKNYFFNSLLNSPGTLFLVDSLYFPGRYIQLLRILCTYVFQCLSSANTSESNSKLSIAIQWVYVLQINLLYKLVRYSSDSYRLGLKLLIKETPMLSVPIYQKEFFFSHTTKGVSSADPNSIRDTSELTYKSLEQNVNNIVPDWTEPSKCNDFLDQNTTYNLSTKTSFPSPQTGVLKAKGIPKLTLSVHSLKKYRSKNFYSQSSSFGQKKKVTQPGPRTAGLDKKGTISSAFYLFYQNQVITKSPNPDFRTFFTQPSWKLSLNRLHHTDSRKHTVNYNSFSFFTPTQDEIYRPPFKTNNFRAEECDDFNSDLASLSIRKLTGQRPNHCYLSENKVKKQIKSPILAYNYTIQKKSAKVLLIHKSTKTLNTNFYCLLEAATRNWIVTIQKNPFGKIMVLLCRKS